MIKSIKLSWKYTGQGKKAATNKKEKQLKIFGSLSQENIPIVGKGLKVCLNKN